MPTHGCIVAALIFGLAHATPPRAAIWRHATSRARISSFHGCKGLDSRLRAAMPTGRAITVELIKKYEKLECLWNMNDEHYRNKVKRFRAMKELLPILKKVDERANIYSVRKRIASLRNCFMKEYNKVKVSLSSGNSDDVHVPKLWYYNLLLFLIGQKSTEPYDSKEYNALLNETECYITDDNQDMENITYTEVERLSSPFETNVSEQNSKNRVKYESGENSTNVYRSQNSSVIQPRLQFSAFGEHVAEKLREMDSDSAKYCQKIINDAIFEAEFNKLNHTSRIVTDCLQHHPAPAQKRISCQSQH